MSSPMDVEKRLLGLPSELFNLDRAYLAHRYLQQLQKKFHVIRSPHEINREI